VSTLKRITLAIVVLGSMLIAGASAHSAAGVQAARPTSDIVRFLGSGNVNMSTLGRVGNAVTILSANVPAGSWVIQATDDVVNFGPSDYTRCAIFNASGPLAGVTTMVGNPNLAGSQGPGSYVAALATTAYYIASTDAVLSLKCWHDNDTPDGSVAPYVDAGAAMWFHAAASLDGATQ
jgi:hypothetical protein